MNSENNLALQMKNINMSFSEIQVLFNVNFSLKKGEINCLVGENGAGKSTLVKILSGVNTDYTGDVWIEDKYYKIASPIISKEIGIHSIQQHRDLVPSMNTVENIFLGEMILNNKNNFFLDYNRMREEAIKLLNIFEVEINVDIPVEELKVAEQGIIAICKAISSDCKILLVDEASAALDNKARAVLYRILNKLKSEGKGIVYITHHLEEIATIGDRVTVLRGGELISVLDAKTTDIRTLVSAMTGSEKYYDRQEDSNREVLSDEVPVVEFKNVSNRFLNDISFKAYKSQIIGFAGLEGSGINYIAETLYGIENYSEGEILINGRKERFHHPIEAIRANIGYLPVDRKVNGLITCRNVIENMTITFLNQKKKNILPINTMKKMALKKRDELKIKMSSLQQLVEYLSGGNQQKVLLGKWLLADIDLLFLDEPTEGIDVGARADIYVQLHKMAHEDGKTLIIFSDDIDELLTLCTHIFTMSEGSIIRKYDGATAKKDDILTDIIIKHNVGKLKGDINAG